MVASFAAPPTRPTNFIREVLYSRKWTTVRAHSVIIKYRTVACQARVAVGYCGLVRASSSSVLVAMQLKAMAMKGSYDSASAASEPTSAGGYCMHVPRHARMVVDPSITVFSSRLFSALCTLLYRVNV